MTPSVPQRGLSGRAEYLTAEHVVAAFPSQHCPTTCSSKGHRIRLSARLPHLDLTDRTGKGSRSTAGVGGRARTLVGEVPANGRMTMGADEWSALAGVSSTVLALAAVAVALVAFRSEHQRARFEGARALHHDLTTGEVAAARKTVGSLHYGGFGPSPTPADWSEALTSYFTLLWCFERIEAGRTALARGVVRSGHRRDEAVDYLDALVAWHVAEYACGFAIARRKLAEASSQEVSDGDSASGFNRLLLALQERGLVDRAYRAGTCPGARCPCACHQQSSS